MSPSSAKLDGYSTERRNREITEKITSLMASGEKYPLVETADWKAYLFVALSHQGLPPCIWLVNDTGAGEVLEFKTVVDAQETFRELQDAAKEMQSDVG